MLEVGCGPGAAARAVAELVGPVGHVLAVDRSPRAIEQVVRTASDLITEGRISVRHVAVEDLVLLPGELPTTWRLRCAWERSTDDSRTSASRHFGDSQCRSVREVVRSETAIAISKNHPELVEPSRRIPFFAYIHDMSMTPKSLAEQVRHWVHEFRVPPLERPEMIIVRDQGVYNDLSSPAAILSRRAVQRGPDQWARLQGHQLWSDAGSLALGFGILMNGPWWAG